MIPIPLNRAATQRLARKSSGPGRKNVPQLYLKAFGVTDLSLNTIPEIFNPDFIGEWRAFIEANRELHADPVNAALTGVLSFLKYATYLKLDVVNERFRFRDPVNGGNKVDGKKIRLVLLNYMLTTKLLMAKRVLESNRIGVYFKPYKNKVASVMGRKSSLIATYVLTVTNNRMSFDGVMALLRDTLYPQNIPPQLAPNVKKVGGKTQDQRPYYDALMNGVGVIGWYPIARNSEFDLFATRARNGYLVLKFILHVPTPSADNGDLPLSEYIRMWKRFKLF